MADEPTEDSRPSAAGARPAAPPADPAPVAANRSWRGVSVGLAGGVAVVLLVLAVTVASRGGGGTKATSTTTTTTTNGQGRTTSTGAAVQPTNAGPSTTRIPTPLPIFAADDHQIVVLDQSGAPARSLFDLGPSASTDPTPPSIGGISFSSDGKFAYFDVTGTPAAGALKRVPVAGGPAQDLGPGLAPTPSPDGSTLALIQAPEPDTPATLVVRAISGSNERRFQLPEATCGNVAWAPSRREVAVDLCSSGEPTTVALVDVASGGIRQLNPPDGTSWSVPAFKPDGTLTLVEQREQDAAVVALAPDRNTVATTILRRPSTSISTIDWSSAGDLLICDIDGIIIEAIGGTRVQQVASGYIAAAW